MGTALADEHFAQPLVHFFRSDKLAGPAAGKDFLKTPAFQVFDFQTVAQLFNALVNDRADTGIPSRIHQLIGKRVLLVSEKNREIDGQEASCCCQGSPGQF